MTRTLFVSLLLASFQVIGAEALYDFYVDGKACGIATSAMIMQDRLSVKTAGGIKCRDTPPVKPPPPKPEPSPPTPGVRTVDPGKGLTFLPTCVNGRHWATSNCEFTGSMRGDLVYAIRVDNAQGSTNSFREARISRSETGDSRVPYQIAVSTVPGKFDVKSVCTSSSSVTTLYAGVSHPRACPVPLGVVYVNVRVVGNSKDQCGRGLTCRPKVYGNFIYGSR